uniref:sodium channel subunit beta-1 n=1 Tax=Monopterus albus TaxID=43700 RepID=UPI0009B3AD2F|nr:sodium channel subunit beta-1-like [Monopterus albus]
MNYHLSLLVVFSLFVSPCHSGCAEVDSLTEAVAGGGFLMGCISCKRREEVSAQTTVDWHFKPLGEEEFRHIFHYDHPSAEILHEDFHNRLEWHGTQNHDIQTGTIYIHNVTFNDTGTFRCTFHRTLLLPLAEEHVTVTKEVELSVVAVANRELTAVISEIMMCVLIVVLQLWLIAVLVYCYKKISNEHEAQEARKALKAQKTALLEPKDNCDRVQLE